MTPRYHLNVFWSDEDECWIADVPDLKYCSAHGDTAEQAVHEARIMIEAVMESLVEHGDPVPEAKYVPEIYAMRKAA